MPTSPTTVPLGLVEPALPCVAVAVPVPLRRVFTYRVPQACAAQLEVGSRVAVPFAGQKLVGYVVGEADASSAGGRLKPIAGVVDPGPVFTKELLAFLTEAAEYYLHPLGEVLRAAAPPLPTDAIVALRKGGFLAHDEALRGTRVATRRVRVVRLAPKSEPLPEPGRALGPRQRRLLELLQQRAEWSLRELQQLLPGARQAVRSLEARGWVLSHEQDHDVDPYFSSPAPAAAVPTPNAAQQTAIERICAALGQEPNGFLLHGVTGSGKTEVYLRVIAAARQAQLGALMLVPEIALTPQLVGRFRARFGDAIAVLHSGLSVRQRADAWQSLRAGRVGIAIGARSALFAPVSRLGVIVVDEEHDASFKQEEGFRYHARDMALLRSHRAGAVCVLGSATPSLESYHLTGRGKLSLLELPERATLQRLPAVQIVDLERNRAGPSGHPLLSTPLHRAIEQCLAQEGQAILFLNRRGFSPSMRCCACHRIVSCPACSVALTEHRSDASLRCHYCDFRTPVARGCPQCAEPGARASAELVPLGVGTERLEHALADTFAPARVARLDRDTAGGSGLERVLERFRQRQIDILVGTQMVTKGHDMPGVTLVGVVLADQSLAFPDFRAAERTFQLLAQVAGRSGRGEEPGVVLLQTYQPEQMAIACAAAHDFGRFYRTELAARRELGYPPFTRLVAVRVDAGDESKARRAADVLARQIRSHPAVRGGEVHLLGPAPAPIRRLRGRFRYRLMLRGASRAALRSAAGALRARIDQGLSPARALIDVDPISML